MKRTSNETLLDLADAPDLAHLVQDKRSQKRATSSKGRRRNRRYENRLLSATVDLNPDFNCDLTPDFLDEGDKEFLS